MKNELQNYQIADFALQTKFEGIGEANMDQLKRPLLDSIGSFIYDRQIQTSHGGCNPGKKKHQIIETIQQLEQEGDINQLIGLICVQSKSYESVAI